MDTVTTYDQLAASLRGAYAGVPIAPVRDSLPAGDIDAAYAVQNANTAFWEGEGRRVVGCKIGLTSPAVQKQLGVDRPDFGILFADMAVGEGEAIAAGRVLQPKIEAEIALVMERDIDTMQPTLADIASAIAFVLPALEIVGSRIADWKIGIVDTIADNASSGLYVLGGPAHRLDGLDLRSCKMRLERDGEMVSSGTGSACLGHPLNAATWLAGEVARRGRPLRAGDVVLTGALGPMVPVQPGDVFTTTIEGLGTASAFFAKKS